MFRVHRAIARVLSTTSIAIPRARVAPAFAKVPSRTFIQCRPRWSDVHPSQEQAATSESTDAVSTESPAANESAPPADQEAAAVSETTDEVAARPARKQTESIYVGNISYETTEDQLRGIFEQYGNVERIDLIKNDLGRPKGFVFVHFDNKEACEKAVHGAQNLEFDGRRLFVQHSSRQQREFSPREPRSPAGPSSTLFIGNLSYQMSDSDLNDLFRDIRGILDVRVAISRTSGQPRGFAHADFKDIESATAARALLSSKTVYGRPLKIDFAKSSTSPRN